MWWTSSIWMFLSPAQCAWYSCPRLATFLFTFLHNGTLLIKCLWWDPWLQTKVQGEEKDCLRKISKGVQCQIRGGGVGEERHKKLTAFPVMVSIQAWSWAQTLSSVRRQIPVAEVLSKFESVFSSRILSNHAVFIYMCWCVVEIENSVLLVWGFETGRDECDCGVFCRVLKGAR